MPQPSATLLSACWSCSLRGRAGGQRDRASQGSASALTAAALPLAGHQEQAVLAGPEFARPPRDYRSAKAASRVVLRAEQRPASASRPAPSAGTSHSRPSGPHRAPRPWSAAASVPKVKKPSSDLRVGLAGDGHRPARRLTAAGSARRRSSGLLHHPDELLEQVEAVLGPGLASG